MKFTIGIDVGGTNTDGVLYDAERRAVERCVKIPTRHGKYNLCIEEALTRLLDGVGAEKIISLNISTTLSTNMLLEKKGAPVNLALIGFDGLPHVREEILSAVSPASLLEARGGHSRWGKARAPLDEDALRGFAEAHRGELFAVSSYYSPRNPEHELRAAQIIKEAGCAAVTCGHEIARSRLNSVKRTVTAFLNSSLIPVTERLIGGVEESAAAAGISCPIMFLRSDSSLVSAGWCARFPIETIFSGPAASMRGGLMLGGADCENAVVVDMGGTSTDAGAASGGRALCSDEGAVIGDYRTMIPSLQIRSIALGGDSRIKPRAEGGVEIGPERVPPLFCRDSDSAFTPSDALCVLGLLERDGAEASAAGAARCGAELGLSARAFAEHVKREVTRSLAGFVESVGGSECKVVCVGAPISAFAGDCGARFAVPPFAPVASAAGAASSSLSLCCSASLLHNFLDDDFRLFLPAATLRGTSADELLARAKAELASYVKEQARGMGFDGVKAEISCEYEYIGNRESEETLAAVYITARALVQNAQK